MHFFASETIINKKRAVRQIILASTANIGYNVREKESNGMCTDIFRSAKEQSSVHNKHSVKKET